MSDTKEINVHVEVPIADPNVTRLIAGLRKAFAGPITASEIAVVLNSAMEMVEGFGTMSGPVKKKTVLTALQEVLAGQSEISPEIKKSFMDLAPGTIDMLVYTAKHLPSYAQKIVTGKWCC
jgi:DNA-binding NarL/FixJ family response regulator